MDTAPATHDITGLILAGGRGQRMGGADKGLQSCAGRPLVVHVVERIVPQVGKLLIGANRNPESYAALGFPVVADRIKGFAGPLAGIHAGLTTSTTPLLATAPCDAPFLPLDLVARLREALLLADAEIALAATGTGLHPTFALMRREVLPSLSSYLADGRHRVQDWCRSRAFCVVDFADERAFANINTLDELALLGRTG